MKSVPPASNYRKKSMKVSMQFHNSTPARGRLQQRLIKPGNQVSIGEEIEETMMIIISAGKVAHGTWKQRVCLARI